MEYIRINNVDVKGHQIEVSYEVSSGLVSYFDTSTNSFQVDYSEIIDDVPVGIAIIPFVCNVLPIVWLTNALLQVPEIDKTFFESINDFKKGYVNMYPMLCFAGNVKADVIRDYFYDANGGNAAFFSGGVDSFATLLAHRNEHPILLTIKGADIKLDDEEGWNNVYEHIHKTANQFNLSKPVIITSTFRTFLDEGELNQLVQSSGDCWWYGFQHGIGIIGHAAPIAYIKQLNWIYIASTATPKDIVTCASHYTIDNYIRFGNSRILHDQLEHNRQDKIQKIIHFCKSTERHIDLRVCWISRGGKNCCHCEKCIRTMFALLAEGESPRDYGFKYSEDDLLNSKRIVIESLYKTNDFVRSNWNQVKKRFIETGRYKSDKRINWVYMLDPYVKRPDPSFLKRVKRKFYSILQHF